MSGEWRVGLSICKRIVNLHEGNIWISENKPSGTRFHFTISKTLNIDSYPHEVAAEK
ncbi:MAG: ATP-binding protein [Saprospiraceae bacterium]|nr:ATP-binding protein [Saprospiraceae bacterium]